LVNFLNKYLGISISEIKLIPQLSYLWCKFILRMAVLRWITIVFIFVFSFNVYAQEFHGGVTAGFVGSQVAGDTYSGYRKAGLFLGGYVGWEFTKHSGLQLELTYFQKGSRENPTEDNNYDYYLFRANYVELPVLYQYKIGKFIVEGGPSLGFLINYFEENEVEVISDLPGYNRPVAVTLQINLGLRFFITEKLGVDFRTNNSLLNIRTENRTGDVWRLWGYGQFHDALVLSLFWQFR
jgi:hypothetical protein